MTCPFCHHPLEDLLICANCGLDTEPIGTEDWREAYMEDVHNRPIISFGKGDKSDRTHKMFQGARLNDNRYIPPWT